MLNIRRFFIMYCLFSLVWCLPIISHGAPQKTILDAKQQQLGKIKNRISTLESTLSKTQTQRSHTLDNLKQTDLTIAKLSLVLARLNTNMNTQTKRLVGLTQQAKQKQQAFNRQQILLAQQLRAEYAIGDHSYLKMLLNQEDPNIISRLTTYYRYLNKARLTRMETIKQLLADIANNQQQIRSTLQQLQQLQSLQQQQRQQMTQARNHQRHIIKQLGQQIKNKQQQLVELTTNKTSLEKVILSLKHATQSLVGKMAQFAKQRGRLPWPTQGTLSKHYGSNIGQSQLNYSGIFIKAKRNQPVYATHQGKVVFANWLRGFGLLLIIEHDHGYMTLYAHNNSLYKRAGDSVTAGELIATVGSSGGKLQDGLYFEVRHKGKPQNPELWIARHS